LLFCQVLQLDARHDAIVADIWQWLLEEWACKSVEEQLHNDLGPADPLHLIATLIMTLPPVSTPADAAAVRLRSLSLGVDGAASETHMNPHQLKSKSKRLLSTQLGPPAKRLKSVDGCSDASTNLTLQPSVTGWPTRSLRSSAVRLLPSVRLDQLKATMLAHGCAHIEHAVSASLVSQIFREMQPWLDQLCPDPATDKISGGSRTGAGGGGKISPSGATIEFLADGQVRECESNRHVDLQSLTSFAAGLLQELLNDPQLLSTAQHAFGADTVIHPQAYLRIRRPQHYTRLHSDYSFFLDHKLLDSKQQSPGHETACTVWIPLRPCAPETGALLLLPDTHKLAQPSVMKAGGSVPKTFDVKRWKKLGHTDGYSVSSADMQTGSALLFGPTFVHGGALRADSSSAPRYSIDIRFVRQSLSSGSASPPPTHPSVPLFNPSMRHAEEILLRQLEADQTCTVM